MNSYFSTFITGFESVVSSELVNRLQAVKIILLTDGLIIYTTSSSINEIRKLRFLNNSFVLLRKYEQIANTSLSEIDLFLLVDPSLADDIQHSLPRRALSFRIRGSIRNQFVSIDKQLLARLEQKIIQANSRLHVDRSQPDTEILIALRSEGFALVGLQFTTRSNYEKTLEKGELYPELATILCLISEPDKNDVFFDPFAGHGAIIAQRLNFDHKHIIASEIDRQLLQKLRVKFSTKAQVIAANPLKLSTFTDNSIDKIVTDPPWGLHDSTLNSPQFYRSALEELSRVLKPNGIMVVLTAQKELLEQLIPQIKGKLILEAKYTTLVSGKKAGVYKIRKL